MANIWVFSFTFVLSKNFDLFFCAAQYGPGHSMYYGYGKLGRFLMDLAQIEWIILNGANPKQFRYHNQIFCDSAPGFFVTDETMPIA